MNDAAFTPQRLAELRQHYQNQARPPVLACGTVRDFCDSMDRLRELSTIQGDLKDLQRSWMFKTIIGTLPPGGRLLEIGAGEPYVADLLARSGFEVWVVDPYDGSGRGPTEFEAFTARYPGVKFIRSQFGTHLTELPEGSFDAVYSISVLEHIPLAALTDVTAATRRSLRCDGWSIHAIDHVYLGAGSAYHVQMLELLCREHQIPQRELDRVLAAVPNDPDIYFLSAEAHNLWRGTVPYDLFPMRRCVSVNITTTSPVHPSAHSI